MTKIIQSAYARIIKQDTEWLEKNSEYSLEREHIKSVLEDSIEKFYPIIDEDKLDELADNFEEDVFYYGEYTSYDIKQAFKAGYRKAKEE